MPTFTLQNVQDVLNNKTKHSFDLYHCRPASAKYPHRPHPAFRTGRPARNPPETTRNPRVWPEPWAARAANAAHRHNTPVLRKSRQGNLPAARSSQMPIPGRRTGIRTVERHADILEHITADGPFRRQVHALRYHAVGGVIRPLREPLRPAPHRPTIPGTAMPGAPRRHARHRHVGCHPATVADAGTRCLEGRDRRVTGRARHRAARPAS